jgi:hypothetical protein
MRTTANDELTEAVAELRRTFPEMRLGQLVLNLAAAAGVSEPAALWDVDDDALLTAARRLLERNRGRNEVAE